jgi:copper chaperone NosL
MKKKRSVICNGIIIIFVVVMIGLSGNFAFADENSCSYCGMKKAMFGHSWMNIERMDGSVVGVCSVHCAAVDMALHTHMPVNKITVGDYNTKKQIDADTAFWVIGGDRMGVMTARAKWAFDTKDEADVFIKAHGGRPAIFNEVMKSAFEDMYEDTLMIQKKKKTMKMKKQ